VRKCPRVIQATTLKEYLGRADVRALGCLTDAGARCGPRMCRLVRGPVEVHRTSRGSRGAVGEENRLATALQRWKRLGELLGGRLNEEALRVLEAPREGDERGRHTAGGLVKQNSPRVTPSEPPREAARRAHRVERATRGGRRDSTPRPRILVFAVPQASARDRSRHFPRKNRQAQPGSCGAWRS
jgi:hypothetical protein